MKKSNCNKLESINQAESAYVCFQAIDSLSEIHEFPLMSSRKLPGAARWDRQVVVVVVARWARLKDFELWQLQD